MGANDYVTKPDRLSRGARADRARTCRTMGGRRSARERRALCPRRARRQRRTVGLESVDERGLLVAALEGDAGLRRAGHLGATPRNGSRACIPTISTASRRPWPRTLRTAAGTSRASIDIRHRNEMFRWVRCRGAAVRNGDGTATRLAGSLTDITETQARGRADGPAQPDSLLRSGRTRHQAQRSAARTMSSRCSCSASIVSISCTTASAP